MKKIFKFWGLITLIFVGQISYGQSNKEQAILKAREAIKLEDEEGKFDEAIKLLEEAQRLDPESINYPYEIAYACSGKKDYKRASDILEKLLDHKDVHAQVYQALGNAYDYQGNADKAINTYEKGVSKFPNAGGLYLELGNMKMAKKDYNNALAYYEKGIESNPEFPSNYYWASKIFCSSNEEVWGILYGEIFMNLERNSKRTIEISKLLYDTYKSQIQITGDSAKIDFCNIVINADDITEKDKIKFPFCMVFGQAFMLSMIGVNSIDLNSLNKIRLRFIENYFKMGLNKTHPNLLFSYQDKVLKAEHFEAYNYWLLMKGDENSFIGWQQNNKEKWDSFAEWFGKNKIQVNLTNKFFRRQY